MSEIEKYVTEIDNRTDLSESITEFNTEDLNGDRVAFRSIRLPKYASFNKKTGLFKWRPRNNQRGPHDVIITAIDVRGATTAHQFQIHVFENPDARRFVNTGWPLMLTFVGVMFAWGVAQF